MQRVQFISNEALDKAEFTNDSKYSKIRLNTLPVNNYANHNRYPKAIINHYNSSFQSKNRPFTTRPVMSSSTTMPSISNVFSNQYSQLKTNYSSYAICLD
ncbi:hypothetical protein BpHYR1_023204 [Brachionus plicatilis]|uniref:Uncharacterized protein n=1 Tax=Brachionus plicatilis TaxID=10195 RepID=A0A3M7PTU6_BRAPC|nr:hypothetical protein BpHYR1_023204 [Brachionus plicatilis]